MILIKSSICPKCKREFVPAPFNVYKIKSIDYCSYTCYMAAKRALPTSTRMSIPNVLRTVCDYAPDRPDMDSSVCHL